jgi:hypothetical protein
MPAPAQPTNPPAVHGKGGVICIAPTRTGTPVPVALVGEWSLDRSSDKVETTSLGDKNKTFVKGLDNVEGTFTGQFNQLDDTLFEAAESADGCLMEIWPNEFSEACFSGPAWLDVSIKGGVSAAVTIDGSFSANGSWTRTTWGGIAATAATAGTPGTWTPPEATPPANLAALQSGITASPLTAWTVGQHMVLGDTTHAYWNGTAWVAGNAA